MKFEAKKIRNFVVAGHSGCGKTTLCDLMLYKAKAVDRPGSVDAKTSVSDFSLILFQTPKHGIVGL